MIPISIRLFHDFTGWRFIARFADQRGWTCYFQERIEL